LPQGPGFSECVPRCCTPHGEGLYGIGRWLSCKTYAKDAPRGGATTFGSVRGRGQKNPNAGTTAVKTE
jgi:hypothetical protein